MNKKIAFLYIDGALISGHIIKEIHRREKGEYNAARSMNSFAEDELDKWYKAQQNGTKPAHKAVAVYNFTDWEIDMKGVKNHEMLSCPMFEHQTVKDFFDKIGFDNKTKKYY